jgi:hypothetical protein
MNEITQILKSVGEVEIIIQGDGTQEKRLISNAVLRGGREALAMCLAGQIGSSFDFYISQMVFGDGGSTGGVPNYVNSERNGLFGITRASKPVISNIDPNMPSQVVFTSVLTFDDANGYTISEMGLVMNNGNFYSMATFAGLGKTSSIQITFNWRISFL